MNCLGVDQAYLYLEDELSPSEKIRIEEHLASCSKCQNAVEDRRLLLQASDSLPFWDLPADFSRQVMERTFPSRVPIRKWVAVSAAGFASAALVLLAYFLLSGQSLTGFFTSLGHSTLDLFRSVSVFFLKFVKLIALFIRIFVRFFEALIQFLSRLTTIVSPKVQIILITLIIILSTSLLFGVRRKLLSGVKHEK